MEEKAHTAADAELRAKEEVGVCCDVCILFLCVLWMGEVRARARACVCVCVCVCV